jgi:hypothetical protein
VVVVVVVVAVAVAVVVVVVPVVFCRGQMSHKYIVSLDHFFLNSCHVSVAGTVSHVYYISHFTFLYDPSQNSYISAVPILYFPIIIK